MSLTSPAGTEAPVEALHLSESISLAIEEGATSIFDASGCVPVHIIRPGVGKGRGRHLYEAGMLSRNAHKFEGWRMYVDHQSPEARKAAGGLPRSVRDLGGRIVEAKWDASVPADPVRGYGQGAVVGRARPVPFIRELIENDPALIEASISASATGVKPVNHDGQRVWMVEGISDRGSVDWVTEAGAGGRVAPLIEASYSSEEAVEMALLESMSDEEVTAFLRESRPHLVVTEAEVEAEVEDNKDEKSKLNESEEDDMALTPEALQEALAAHPEVLVSVLNETNLAEIIDARVEEALSAEREIASAERDAHIARQWELRDLSDTARKLITESKLPDTWQESLSTRFSLREDRTPTPELDVVDDVDDDGKLTKSAAEKLRESVTTAIDTERAKLREVAPTRVRGQGAAQPKEGEEAVQKSQSTEKPYYAQILEEAGVNVEQAYA